MYTIYTSFRIIITAPREQHGCKLTKFGDHFENTSNHKHPVFQTSICSKIFRARFGALFIPENYTPPPLKKRTRNPSRKLEKTTPLKSHCVKFQHFQAEVVPKKTLLRMPNGLGVSTGCYSWPVASITPPAHSCQGMIFFCVVFMFFWLRHLQNRGTIFFNKSWLRESQKNPIKSWFTVKKLSDFWLAHKKERGGQNRNT